MTPIARRSFTDPSGLNASILTKMLTPAGARRLMRATGVLPIVSMMLEYGPDMTPPAQAFAEANHGIPIRRGRSVGTAELLFLQRNVSVANHACELRKIRLDLGREFFGRAAHRLLSTGDEPL